MSEDADDLMKALKVMQVMKMMRMECVVILIELPGDLAFQ